jgi:branched-chain amino acid aminotransferase
MMNIEITYTNKGTKASKDLHNVLFGELFTDKMFTMRYLEGKGWYNAKIEDFAPFILSPAALVFHYAQEMFEGLKAYKWEDGSINLFRPGMNINRMNSAAARMCMPHIDENFFMKVLKTFVWEDRDWIPAEKDHSLYIRPAMIATDPMLGVKIGKEYIFFIIHSPVGPYFVSGFSPVKIWVSDRDIRSCVGGTGNVKTGGNYAASLRGGEEAKSKGFSQVLWLDGRERKYVEEVGSMNIFFVQKKKLITPDLIGSILPGVTRDSIITMAKDMGFEVEERRISIDEVCKGFKSGEITECFGCGTACVITPVSELSYKDTSYTVSNGKAGTVTKKLYDTITGIQYGSIKDKFNWMTKVTAPVA